MLYFVGCKVPAQALLATLGRPSRMPIYGGQNQSSRPLTEAGWIKRFDVRCERIAEISNRPAVRYLRSHFICPMPPNVYIPIGTRRWHNLFRLWRDLCYAMAEENGFEFDD